MKKTWFTLVLLVAAMIAPSKSNAGFYLSGKSSPKPKANLPWMSRPGPKELTLDQLIAYQPHLRSWCTEEMLFTEVARRINEYLLTEGFVADLQGNLWKDGKIFYRSWVTWREARELWVAHGAIDPNYHPRKVKTCGGDPEILGRINQFVRDVWPCELFLRADIMWLAGFDCLPKNVFVVDLGTTHCGNPGENADPPRLMHLPMCCIPTPAIDTVKPLCTLPDSFDRQVTWKGIHYCVYKYWRKDCIDGSSFKKRSLLPWLILGGAALGGGITWIALSSGDDDGSSPGKNPEPTPDPGGGPGATPGQLRPANPSEPSADVIVVTKKPVPAIVRIAPKALPAPKFYLGVTASFSLSHFSFKGLQPFTKIN